MSGSKRTLAGVATVLALAVVIGGAALLYANRDGGGKESASSALSVYARGSLGKLLTPAPAPAPDYVFKDAEGRDVRFADFTGRVTVVNLWATWCAPCKIEMPTLAALAEHYKDRDDVAVVTISMDVDKAVPEARAFIAEHPPLVYYADPRFQLPFEFPGKGAMPQTILLDRQGKVRAVLTGEADWASDEAKALVEALLAEEDR
ncbi:MULTISPECIES: TlpA disulfide reductase family protein [unclassified Brevundimonas]|uniref:TlpA family protein disulfide reductase n=1 Tax=unclassified Brevundimonas TaxID=2622653 RepID=UPI000CFE347A|nr:MULTISPECIES: TlpA disulfide reductase family protein [unclassified Brevundimonas]PRA35346.1 antioxidant AhpC [Brevundimonas sp. MYb27]PQZ82975.1 antioxidant AhpC [Brevundimonas sp. MYb31]PRB15000.1 antioxidant AhpC [Brevundimonas sp. MYb52]PRB36897.1 antioxidant AhpC [Brevundimonas sp. MYb46]PRB52203.1 antioxidant AhpC [Brevundimonas sp. MYb33]